MCVFCAIVGGSEATDVVLEDDVTVAFLDRRPLFPGHCLLVPRQHVETLPDLPPQLVEPFFSNAQRLAEAVPAAVGAEGTFVAINNVVSQSIRHLHLHVVPRRRKDGLKGFFWPRRGYESDAQRAEVAAAIRSRLGEGANH